MASTPHLEPGFYMLGEQGSNVKYNDMYILIVSKLGTYPVLFQESYKKQEPVFGISYP